MCIIYHMCIYLYMCYLIWAVATVATIGCMLFQHLWIWFLPSSQVNMLGNCPGSQHHGPTGSSTGSLGHACFAPTSSRIDLRTSIHRKPWIFDDICVISQISLYLLNGKKVVFIWKTHLLVCQIWSTMTAVEFRNQQTMVSARSAGAWWFLLICGSK